MSDHIPQNRDDSQLGPLLGNTLSAMASYPDAAPLATALPRVHRRVAGRRVAKIGGITVGATALAVGMAIGAWSAPWNDGAPVIPAVPTPSPSSVAPTPEPSTPSPASSETPSAPPTTDPSTAPSTEAPTPDAPTTEAPAAPEASRTALADPHFTDGVPLPYGNGIAPWWTCGASIDNLLSQADDSRVTLEITGEIVFDGVTPARFTAHGDGIPEGYAGGSPRSVWTQDGRIVEGHLWSEGGTGWEPREAWDADPTYDEPVPPVASLPPGAALDTGLYTGTSRWACGTKVPDEGQVDYDYLYGLPAGEYEVYAVAWYSTDPETDPWHYVVSDPVTVTVPSS